MRIKIRMVSGDVIEFDNDKYKSLEDWMNGNFKGDIIWYQLSKNYQKVIKYNNIESIEIVDV